MNRLRLCENDVSIGTIAGGAVHEPFDVRLGSLWHHDSVKASWPREYRAALINEASRAIVKAQ